MKPITKHHHFRLVFTPLTYRDAGRGDAGGASPPLPFSKGGRGGSAHGWNGRNIEIYVKFSGIDFFKNWVTFKIFLPLFWWIKVPEKFFGNEILISDCPYVNIAPLCPTLAPASLRISVYLIATVVCGYKGYQISLYLKATAVYGYKGSQPDFTSIPDSHGGLLKDTTDFSIPYSHGSLWLQRIYHFGIINL
jgi:hypothetical protein